MSSFNKNKINKFLKSFEKGQIKIPVDLNTKLVVYASILIFFIFYQFDILSYVTFNAKTVVFIILGFTWLSTLSSFKTGHILGHHLNRRGLSRAVLYLFVITFFILYYFFFSSPRLIFAASTPQMIRYACEDTASECSNNDCDCSEDYNAAWGGCPVDHTCDISQADCGSTGCSDTGGCTAAGGCHDVGEDDSGDDEYCPIEGNTWWDVDFLFYSGGCTACVGSNNWDIGFPCGTNDNCSGTNLDSSNELIEPSCCGDDTGEAKRTCSGEINNGACDADDVCCDSSNDCEWSNNCASSGNCYTTGSYKSYCNSTGDWNDPDNSSTTCTATGCSFSWNSSAIDWEPATTTSCCGDDDGENAITCTDSSANGNCGSPTDACCDVSNDCVDDSGDCQTTGSCYTFGTPKSYCNTGTWEDPDEDTSYCTASGCNYIWNSSATDWEIGTPSCCGDDSGEANKTKLYWEDGSDDPNTWACCDNSNDCVDSSSNCYASGYGLNALWSCYLTKWDQCTSGENGQYCGGNVVACGKKCDASDLNWRTCNADHTDNEGVCESACTANSNCDEKATGADLNRCDLTGQTYFEDECSSTCGLQDVTSVCECSETGCTCNSTCDGIIPNKCGVGSPPGGYCNTCVNETGETSAEGCRCMACGTQNGDPGTCTSSHQGETHDPYNSSTWLGDVNEKCCGDESNEYYTNRSCYSGVCSNSSSDIACCDSNTDCVYNGVCYSHGTKSDVDGDGWDEECSNTNWIGLPPKYSLNNTNTTTPCAGDAVLIYANWTDDVGLNISWLWTNETGGSGKNYTETGVGGSENWADTNCNYRRTLTFDNSAASENLANFPIMVLLNSTRIEYTNTSQTDIRFYDNDNSTLLKKETEIWNESGDSFIWVKVTQVDNSATDYIWTYYNCSDTNSDDATNVWDNNYVGVWHLNETSGLTYDSTSYNNDGSPIGSPNQDFTAGKIDGADDFSGVSQYTTISDTSVLDMSSSFAIEVWVYSDGTQNAYAGVVAKDQAGNFGNYGFFFDAAGTTLRFGFYDTGSAQKEVDTQGAIPTTQWVHFAGVFNDSGDFLEIYQDGVSKEKDATISTTPAANANNLTFASRIAGLTTYEFDGKIDEVRISNTTRSVSWINASYLSGKDQFITYGGSAEQYSAGSSSNYNSPIDINLTDGETWSNFTWQNSSISAGTIIAWKIYANDTSGNENVTEGTFTIQSSWLEVSLITPTAGSNTNVAQNSTFTVNATVYCRGCSCGNVNGTVRYNGSSSNPDTQINTTTGDKPFYIDETSPKAMKECPTNPLSQDEFCNITWTVNATGTQNSVWKIGVLFNSSISGIDDNHTNNATITITEEQESIKLSWTKITFPNLAPSTAGNNATNNNIGGYNITNDGTCTLQTWINGTDLTNQSITPVPSTIGVGNISYSNSTNDYASSTRMTTSYALIGASHTADTNITTYYWFDVPSIYAGNYTGNVTICGNCTSIC